MTDTTDAAGATANLDIVAVPVSAERTQALTNLVGDLDLQVRIDEVADVLAGGSPTPSLELIGLIASEHATSSSPSETELRSFIYWAGVSARVRREDFGQVVAGMEERLLDESCQSEPGWGASDEGQLCLEWLAATLAPLAGLDMAATVGYAKLYVDNFPPFSRPLGDVDERAARWLAQLLDTGATRPNLRQMLSAVASAWEELHPRASAQVKEWAEGRLTADPTQDEPWMRAMLAVARTQV